MPRNHSRRDFLRQSAVLGAGAVPVGATDAIGQPGGALGRGPFRTDGMAAYSTTGPLRRMAFDRRALQPKDVAIRIRYSGVCHSDIHTIRGQMNLVLYRNALAGSNTGGIAETQDMVDFCARNKIAPEITKIPMSGIDAAWEKVLAKQARYRFVIDVEA